jgi:hypothetical protein
VIRGIVGRLGDGLPKQIYRLLMIEVICIVGRSRPEFCGSRPGSLTMSVEDDGK